VNGDKSWYINGKRHREDGPAAEYINGFKSWWSNGERHREDGPAVINSNGYKEWWLNGVKIEQPLLSNVKAIDKENNCPICVDEMVISSELHKTQCNHVFHISCLTTWIKNKSSCPLCRAAL
jgi:hypothetical protein